MWAVLVILSLNMLYCKKIVTIEGAHRMGLIAKIQNKTEQARAKERIRPLLESRMMRDILLEIGQRGTMEGP